MPDDDQGAKATDQKDAADNRAAARERWHVENAMAIKAYNERIENASILSDSECLF